MRAKESVCVCALEREGKRDREKMGRVETCFLAVQFSFFVLGMVRSETGQFCELQQFNDRKIHVKIQSNILLKNIASKGAY